MRYGVRQADDPLMVDSLKVVDAVLKRGLPQGPGWLRYNWDGYGERPDGGPFQGWGKGRVWPLLTGERAHYELAAGKDITELIKTYEGFATGGQMMPEQVWDEANLPGTSLRLGQPAGSAVPLVWAHAEYLKLLRSAVDGKVFDRIDTVYERYCETGRAERSVRNAWRFIAKAADAKNCGGQVRCGFWTRSGLRCVGRWMDGRRSRPRKAAAWAARDSARILQSGSGERDIRMDFPLARAGCWLGYNVEVKIEAPIAGSDDVAC